MAVLAAISVEAGLTLPAFPSGADKRLEPKPPLRPTLSPGPLWDSSCGSF